MFSIKINGKTFLKTKSNFLLIEKYFSLINFSNGKQIQKNLENDF